MQGEVKKRQSLPLLLPLSPHKTPGKRQEVRRLCQQESSISSHNSYRYCLHHHHHGSNQAITSPRELERGAVVQALGSSSRRSSRSRSSSDNFCEKTRAHDQRGRSPQQCTSHGRWRLYARWIARTSFVITLVVLGLPFRFPLPCSSSSSSSSNGGASAAVSNKQRPESRGSGNYAAADQNDLSQFLSQSQLLGARNINFERCHGSRDHQTHASARAHMLLLCNSFPSSLLFSGRHQLLGSANIFGPITEPSRTPKSDGSAPLLVHQVISDLVPVDDMPDIPMSLNEQSFPFYPNALATSQPRKPRRSKTVFAGSQNDDVLDNLPTKEILDHDYSTAQQAEQAAAKKKKKIGKKPSLLSKLLVDKPDGEYLASLLDVERKVSLKEERDIAILENMKKNFYQAVERSKKETKEKEESLLPLIESVDKKLMEIQRSMYPFMVGDTWMNFTGAIKKDEVSREYRKQERLRADSKSKAIKKEFEIIDSSLPLGLSKVTNSRRDDHFVQQRAAKSAAATRGSGARKRRTEMSPFHPHTAALAGATRSGRGAKHEKKKEGDTDGTDNDRQNGFESLGLSPELCAALQRLGFSQPAPIQKAALPAILQGRDGIVQSQSGTGKTSMLAIASVAICERAGARDQEEGAKTKQTPTPGGGGLDGDADGDRRDGYHTRSELRLRTIILSPSRELAFQTCGVVNRIGFRLGIRCNQVAGGKMVKQDRQTFGKAHVCSGTPGRMFQLLSSKGSDVRVGSVVRFLVIDEVDEILGDGFNNILLSIKDRFSAPTQMLLTSATLTPDVSEICEKLTSSPIRIFARREDLARSGLKQYHVAVSTEAEEEKIALCAQIYERVRSLQTIIFANKISTVEALYRRFRNKGAAVGIMHREVPMKERERTLEKLRSQSIMLLVTTDVWARGIDIQSVMATINFDMPYRLETYMHRVGRAGRFYGKGLAVTLVSPDDAQSFEELQLQYAMKIPELPIKFRQKKPAISPRDYHLGQLARENYLRSKRQHR